MKNIALIVLTLFTLAGCSDKRESDISPNFNPGQSVPASSLAALPSSKQTNEDTPYSATLPYVSTNQNEAPVFTVVNQPVHGTVNINPSTGVYTYTPELNYSGPDLFTWQITQGEQSSTASVNINVIPENVPPVANSVSVTVAEDTPLTDTLTGSDPNGDSLTFSTVTPPQHGTLVLNPNGTYTYTPTSNYFGPDSFTFQVSDGSLLSPPATVSIEVTPVNDAPVANNSSFSTPEDTPYNGNLIASDVEGSTLTYTVTVSPQHGVLALNAATGAYTYTPSINYTGTDSFKFTVSDGTLTSAEATVSISVTPNNDAPIALSSSFTTPEDTLYSGTLSGVDPEGDNLTYILTSSPTKGLVTIQDVNLGTFTYQPYPNQTGTDSFTFKVNDGSLDSAPVTVFITITPVNDAPVALNSSFSVVAGNTHNGTVSATDVDSPVLTYVQVSGPTQGTLTFNANGTYTYVANSSASGMDSFTFKANDSQLDSNIATVSVTIGAAPNQAPIAQNQTLSTPEDTVKTGTLVATDPEAAPITFSVVTNPTHGSVVVNANGTFTYTPTSNYSGTDSFTFKANDGANDSNTATVSLTVTPVNDLPIANNANYTITENQTLSITLTGSDVDGDTLTYTIVTGPTNGTLTGTGPNVTYTPNANYNGTDSFTFKVNDGTADSNVATIGVTVSDVNQTPIAQNQTLSTPEDTPLNISLLASDADGDTLTYTVISNPANGTLSGTAPNLTYTPSANFTGTDSFTFKANDGSVDSNVATITINVTPVNDIPVAASQSLTTAEETPINITLIGTDTDGNSLNYTVVTPPQHGTLSGTGQNVTYTPNANYNGTDSFTFKVNDGTTDSNTATVSITVTPVNDAPVANNQAVTTPEDTGLTINLSANDVDGDALTYTLVSNPTHGVAILIGSDVSYIPDSNYTGPDSFTFRVNDGTVDSNTATVSITVTPVNDAPVALAQNISTPEDTAYNGTVTGTDLEGGTLTFIAVTSPTNGVLVLNPNGSFTYTPDADFTGTDSFTFKANDGTSDSSPATVSITVTPVNDAPVAYNQSLTTNEDTALNVTLTGMDVEGSALTYTIVTPPMHGTLSGTAPNLVYTPNANYYGTDTFAFKANDGTTDSNLASIFITINSVNDAPTAIPQNVTVQEDTPVNITLTGTDPDGDALDYIIVTQPTNGTLTGTGPNVVYTPNSNFTGPDSFSFKVNDGTADSPVVTITLNVTPENDLPVANSQSVTTTEDTVKNITLTGSDPENSTLTYTVLTGPTNGTLSGTGANVVYTPNANYTGTDSFTFKVNDGTSDSIPATVSITVTPVNDAPIANNQTVNASEGSPVSVTLSGSDIDGDALTYSVVTPPTNGTLSGTGANLTYTPNTNFNGPDSFTFKVNDGTTDSNIATVSINVSAENDAPVANNQSVTTPEDTVANISLVASDVDGDALTYIITQQPTNGTLVLMGSDVSYIPNANYVGSDSFKFKVNDGTVDSNVATVSITVTPVNDAPVATNSIISVGQGQTVSGNMNATDVEGSPLTYTVITNPTKGTLNYNPSTGSFTYTAFVLSNGQDSFTFKANDGSLDSNVATVTININLFNFPPVANNQTITTPEDTNATGTLTYSDPNQDSVTFSIVSQPANGTVNLNPTTGAFTYIPNLNFNGTDTFTFRVNDGSVNSNTATVTVNVTPVNDAPISNNQSVTTPEDTAKNITLTGSDVEGSPITYTIVSGPTNGTLTGTGANVVYTPNANYNGPDSFTFRTNDGTTNSLVGTVSITVTPANDAPVANNQSVTTPEDTAVNITLTASDIDADTLTYSVVTPPANGTLSGSGSNLTYTPNANFAGSDSFTFRANDGTVNSNIATVSITVTPINDAPAANNLTITTNEDTPANITLSGTDPDGNPLTYIIVTQPTHGTISGTGANITYTPDANYFGPDTFSYKVNDGTTDSNTATVTLNVTPVNDVPVANNQSVTTPEDTAKNITLTATDADGNALTYTIVSGPANGTLSGTGSNVVYTPNANYNGPDSFTFRVNDGTVNSNIATVSINVTAQNDLPVAQAQSVTTPEDTAKNITLVGTDADGDSLSYIIVSAPLHGTLTGAGANKTYTPDLNYNGSDSFTYKVNDGTADSATVTVSITVTPVNDLPVANNQTVTTPEDMPVGVTLTANDVDGDALTYTVVSGPLHGTLSGTGANLTYTPNANYNGPDSFTFKANDGTSDSNVATISLNVTQVNDLPVANNQSVTTPEDTAKNIILAATDADGNTLTYSIVTPPLHGTLSGSGANRTYTPNLNFNGTDSFTFKANDGSVDSNVATVSITVTPVNDAPVAIPQVVTGQEDTPLNITLTGSDVDGDTLTYIIVTQPTHGTLTGTGPNKTYTPDADYNGTDSFTFKVNDGTTDSNTATITLNITSGNDAPVASNQSLTTPEDTALNIVLSGVDSDGNPLTYIIVSGPTNGTLTGTGANRTYTPNANYSGSDSFTYKVNDGSLDSNTATISINVTPVNDAPVATGQSLTVAEDATLNVTLTATDADGNTLTYTIVTPPANGTLTGTGANRVYTPNANYNGPDSFTFRVNDGTVNSNTATIAINVTPVNDAPVANNQTVTTPEDTAANITLVASDIDGNPLTYTIVAGPNNGTLTGSGANRVYTPNANFNGSDTFTFRVNDGTVNSNTATVTINVTPVNDIPIAQNQSVTTPEDTAKNITLVGTDAEGSTLTYVIVSGPTSGTLTGTGANKVYTPNANFNGTDSFTYKVNDGTSDSTVATVSITVTPVNDAPVANAQSVTTPEDTPVNITLTASDVEGSTLTYTIVSGPTNGTLTGTGSNRTYTPNANFTGSDSFTYKVNDGTLDSATVTVAITVTPVNDVPVANNQSIITNEDNAFNGTLTATDGDGDMLIYSVVTQGLKGTVTITNMFTGAFTYTPNPNANGTDTFTFRVNDGTVNSNTATVSVMINPVNDLPVASNQSITTNEDTQFAGTLVASDVDGNALTYSVVAQGTKGTVAITNTATGAFTYTPNANATGSDSFTFKANDGTGDSNIATVSVTITPVNDAPVANNSSFTTNEDTAYNETLSATDVDGNPLTYSVVAQGTKGTVVITNTATGAFTYTPNANANGSDSFTFRVNDGTVNSNTATVAVTITPVPDAPIAQNQSITTLEDTVYTGTLVGSDPDGSVLTYSVVAQGTKGTVAITNATTGAFTYTPNANANGSDSFTFKVNDGTSDSNVATVSVTITPVNDVPVANNQSVSTPEDTAVNITLAATDADGSPLTYTIVSGPTNGTLTGTGANRTYTPNANYNGPDSFTFKANDGTTDSNTATVSITVSPVNDVPVANNQSITTLEDTVFSGTLTATDGDGNPLTYSVVAQGTKGTVVITNTATGAFTYTPNANANGTDSFTFKVNDGTTDSNTATVSVNITPVQDAPVATNQSITTPEDTIYTGTLSASDADGNTLTYSVVTQGAKGTVTITNTATGTFTYTPNANATGSDSFTFKVNDGTSDSNVATVSVNITPVNDAPVSNNQTVTTPEDTVYTGTLTASDVDGNALVYSVVAQGTKGTVTITNTSTGAFTYMPNANANGADTFTFRVNDGTVNSNTATVTVNITPVNDAPIANNQTITTPEDTVFTGILTASDIDANTLTYSVVAQGTKGTVTITDTATGAFTYTPNLNATGADTFTFRVNDGTVNSNTATVTVNITPVNDAPIANNQTITTPEDTVFTGTLVGTDPDGNAITYSVVAQGTKGTVVITNTTTGAFTYTPNANANGSDSFTFRVNDGTVNSNTATVTVNITPVNDAPVAQNQNVTTPEDTNKLINLVGTDVDGDMLSYVIVTQPTNGTLVQVGADVTYIPNMNYNGPDSFTFRVNDGTVNSNTATVGITVTAVNDAPVANNSSFTTNEDTVYNGSVTATDAEGSSLTYSVVTNPTKGVLTFNANGTYTYTPNLNANGSDSFTFRTNDGTVNSNTATVSITITPINDVPVANNQSLTTPEDTAVNITLVANDADGNTLTYTIVNGPTNGTLTGTGASRTYTPNANYSGSDSFTFRVNDGTVNSNTATVSITVTPVNDAPVAQNQSVSTNKNQPYNGFVTATDADGNTLTYSPVSFPTNGTITGGNPATGSFTYVPNAGFTGTDSFTFKANDGTVDSNVATVTIMVVNTNVAPVAQNQTVSVTSTSSNNPITLVATDGDGDALTYTIVSNPSSGTLGGSGANRTYTPAPGFTGTVTFTFKANDGTVDSNTATVTINVNEWCDTTFAYSHKLVLNNQDQTSALNNFPVMVKLNSSRVNYSDIKANGDDLRFYDSACNLIPYEIERWNTAGDSTVWVKVPTIAASSNSSFIWMSYGKASATNAQNKTAVWDSNYVGVYHFEETSGNALDSTANTNTMVPNGTPVRNVGGRVAGAEMFDSNSDRFAAASTPSLAMTTSSSFTLESWVYVVSYNSNANVIERQYSSTDGAIDYGMYVVSGYPYMRARSKALQFNTQLPLSQWVHMVATFDRNTNTCTLFLNGVQKAQSTACTEDLLATGTQPTYIGGDQSNRFFNGSIDEPRISNAVRSNDWIRAQHLSMTDGMVSFGTRRTLGQNFKHVLMTVKTNNDDGYIFGTTSSPSLFQSGSNGINYQGSNSSAPRWGYYRFQLPEALPSGAVIKTARMRLYGRDENGTWTSHYLVVSAQNSANAGQITAANQYPNAPSTGVPLVTTSANWGAPSSINWLEDDWNETPNLNAVIQALKTNQNGLASGNYVQLWVTKNTPFSSTLIDKGSEDSTYETINHAQLMVEYE
jgi:VCBS repeat-containing protein